MQAFDGYVRDTTAKLTRKVEDLEDVRSVMGILKEVCCLASKANSIWSICPVIGGALWRA